MKTDGTNALPESTFSSPERRPKITKTCQNCGKPLTGLQTKYCSKECSNAATRRRELEKNRQLREKLCVQCGKLFRGTKSQTTCSVECRNKRYKKGGDRAAHKEWKSYLKQCENCKKEFVTTDYNRDFCSFKCREYAKYHDPRFTDHASPYLIDGYAIISVEDEITLMTESDIRAWFRDAKDKRFAVDVLAEMNICSKKKIKTIVYKGTVGHVASMTKG